MADSKILDLGSSILVVEDELNVQALLEELFAREAISARIAAEGDAALECARREWPRIVLLDLTLPGRLDGWAVLQALRSLAAGRPLRVLLFTGSLSEAEAALAEQAGVFGLIKKPVSVRQIMQELRRAARSLAEEGARRAILCNGE